MRLLLVSQHSILDFICSLQDGKVPKTTLDEHFRSYPQLASFTRHLLPSGRRAALDEGSAQATSYNASIASKWAGRATRKLKS